MEQIKIKLGDTEYILKRTYKSLILFETQTGKPLSDFKEGVTDNIIMFYCMLKAINKNFEYSFDDFLTLIDDHEDQLLSFNKYMEGLARNVVVKKKKEHASLKSLET
jgi:hypothetical protein